MQFLWKEKEMEKTGLNKKEKENIINEAKKLGLDKNFYFITTLERYEMQLWILAELKKEIDKSGDVLVTKEYVKGRKNVYTHPAIADYNKTTDGANRTVTTLINIINNFKNSKKEDADPLAKMLNKAKNEK